MSGASNLYDNQTELTSPNSFFCKTVTELMLDWVYWVNPEGEVIYVSPYAQSVSGYSPKDFQDDSHLIEEIVHPDDRNKFIEHCQQEFKDAETHRLEFRIITKVKEIRWVEHICVAQYDEDGIFRGRIVRNRDITLYHRLIDDLIKANQELKERQEIFNSGPTVIFKWKNDAKWTVEYVSKNVQEILGYNREDFLSGKINFREIILKDDIEEFLNSVHQAIHSNLERFRTAPYRMRTKFGKIVWMMGYIILLRNSSGEITHFLGYAVDITVQKEREAKLQTHYERIRDLHRVIEVLNRADSLESIYHNALNGIIKILKADRASILLFGEDNRVHFKSWINLSDEYRKKVDGHSPWTKEQMDVEPILVPDIKHSQFEPEIKQIIRSEGIQALAFIPLKGTDRLLGKFMVYYNQPHEFTQEEINFTQILADNLSSAISRECARKDLQESERKYRSLFNNAYEGIYQTTPEGKILTVNPAMARIFGFSSASEVFTIGNIANLYWNTEEREQLSRRLKEKGILKNVEVKMKHREGHPIWVLLNEHIVQSSEEGLLLIHGAVVDITQRKEAEEALKESEERLRALINSTPDIICFKDGQGCWLEANQADLKLFQLEHVNYRGKKDSELAEYTPFYRDALMTCEATDELAWKKGKISRGNKVIPRPDGSVKIYDVIKVPLFNEDGSRKGLVVIGRDITERIQAEEALRENEERFRKLFDLSPDAIFVHSFDEEGYNKFLEVNNVACERYGYTREEFLNLTPSDISAVQPEQSKNMKNVRKELIRKGHIVFEWLHVTKSGKMFPVEVSSTLFNYRGKKAVLSIVRDISERKKAEEAIRKSEERFRSVFEHTGTASLILNRDGTIAFANEQCEELFGVAAENLVGTHWSRYVLPESMKTIEKYLEKRFFQPKQKAEKREIRILHVSGNVKYCLMSIGNIPPSRQMVVSLWDITDRVQAEQERRMLAKAIEYSAEATCIWDQNGRITYVNPEFEKLYGYSKKELIGGNSREILFDKQLCDEKKLQNIRETIYRGNIWRGYVFLRKRDGSIVEIYLTITPIYDHSGRLSRFVALHRDMTREREIERRSQQSQRLEAIGTLAGGIAHDFNNILTPILGYTDLAMLTVPSGSKLYTHLQSIRVAAERARSLVEQILSFSRKTTQERKPITIAPIVKEALKLLRASIPSTIEIKQEIENVELPILADPTEIHQIIVNLCTNAYQAMPEGGTLTVGLHKVEVDSEFSRNHPELVPGPYLKLTVRDTGSGIPPHIQDKIFEPYFTTRGDSGGTGLGLATVHGLVVSYGGTILLHSEVNKGTEFNIYLPAVNMKSHEERAIEPLQEPLSGKENILFLDDELIITDLGASILKEYGYRVVTFNQPHKALEYVKEHITELDLIITDVTMPGITGDKFIAEVRKLNRNIPVILCTGYSDKINPDDTKELGLTKFIRKPFTSTQLIKIVRELLDRAKSRKK